MILFPALRMIALNIGRDARFGCQIGQHRTQVYMPVGKIKHYQAAGRQAIEIDRHTFTGNQMQGNGVRGKSIQNQQIKQRRIAIRWGFASRAGQITA